MMTERLDQSQHSSPSQNDDVVLSVKGVSKKFCRSLKRSGVACAFGIALGMGFKTLQGSYWDSDKKPFIIETI